MDILKKGFIPIIDGKILSKAMCLKIIEGRENMSQIPYTSTIGFDHVCYVM